MKAPCLVASCLLAVSIAAVGARQLLDDIDYERYIVEFEETDVEMKRWKAAYWRNNAWLPSFPRDLSREEIDEDLRQRIFMSKQDVRKAQDANPNAKFSIMTPFSALTKEEFALRIRNVYVYGNSTTKRTDPTPTPKRGTRINTNTVVAAPNPVPFHAITVVAAPFQINPLDGALNPSPVPGKFRFLASNEGHPQPGQGNSDDAPAHSNRFLASNEGHPQPGDPNHSEGPVILHGDSNRYLASAGVTPHPAPISRGLADSYQIESLVLRGQSRASSQTHDSKKRVGRTVDWSDSRCMRSIQSQGECSSCWAFASVAAVESLQCIRSDGHGIRKYSEQELVECDLRNMGCDGGTAKYAFEYIQQNGLCSAKSYPYTSQNGGSESCSASCSRKETGITGYKRLREGNEAELIETLQSQPVVAVVAAGNAAWKQYIGGVLSSCGTSAVDHTVLIVGYDETSFKVRNWWGEEWGEAGHIRLERTSSGSGTCGLLKDMTHPTM